jgi:hypothetical protein
MPAHVPAACPMERRPAVACGSSRYDRPAPDQEVGRWGGHRSKLPKLIVRSEPQRYGTRVTTGNAQHPPGSGRFGSFIASLSKPCNAWPNFGRFSCRPVWQLIVSTLWLYVCVR